MMDHCEAERFVVEHEWLFKTHPTCLFDDNELLERLQVEFGIPIDHNMVEMVSGNGDDKLAEFVRQCKSLSLPDIDGDDDDEVKVRITGVPEKKVYEVHKLKPLITQMAHQLQINHFVDVGAGQGYLDFAVLDHDEQFRVTAVERDKTQLVGMTKRQSTRSDRLSIVELSVDQKCSLSDYKIKINTDNDYIMYSLHSCGSLSDHMCRLFAQDERARGLVCVGCCHNLITAFPQSRSSWTRLQSLNTQQLMAACQAPSRWTHDGPAVVKSEMKNYYRALLEQWTKSRGVVIETIGRVNISENATFVDYCKLAGIDLSIEDTCEIEKKYGKYRGHLRLYWVLRACIGQVIESIILMDRLHHLQSTLPLTSTVSIIPVFSIKHSPRRFAITAVKS